MTPRHFLDLDLVAPGELRAILDDAARLKRARDGWPRLRPDASQPLKDRIVALIFEKPSTRTRISFDVGIRQMGGQTMVLSGQEMQLGHGETVADTGCVLSRYVDAVMIRTYRQETLDELAGAATVPVINGLTNVSHPCQIMADVMTYEERRGPIRGARVTWVGGRQQRFHQLGACGAGAGFQPGLLRPRDAAAGPERRLRCRRPPGAAARPRPRRRGRGHRRRGHLAQHARRCRQPRPSA